jgi:hypothetical protein
MPVARTAVIRTLLSSRQCIHHVDMLHIDARGEPCLLLHPHLPVLSFLRCSPTRQFPHILCSPACIGWIHKQNSKFSHNPHICNRQMMFCLWLFQCFRIISIVLSSQDGVVFGIIMLLKTRIIRSISNSFSVTARTIIRLFIIFSYGNNSEMFRHPKIDPIRVVVKFVTTYTTVHRDLCSQLCTLSSELHLQFAFSEDEDACAQQFLPFFASVNTQGSLRKQAGWHQW